MEPAAPERLRSRLRIVVVPLHHDIAAHDDLAHRRAVVRHLVALVVHDDQFARGDQFDALSRLLHRPIRR